MNIKLKAAWGSAKIGQVVDAGLRNDLRYAVFYDSDGNNWCIGDSDFELETAAYATFTHHETETTGSLPTILDVLGGDVKKLQLDVEFK